MEYKLPLHSLKGKRIVAIHFYSEKHTISFHVDMKIPKDKIIKLTLKEK